MSRAANAKPSEKFSPLSSVTGTLNFSIISIYIYINMGVMYHKRITFRGALLLVKQCHPKVQAAKPTFVLTYRTHAYE